MNNSLKLALLGAVALASVGAVGGCGSNDSSVSPDFEKAIRAPKGPMPPEARAAMEKAMANQNASKPVARP